MTKITVHIIANANTIADECGKSQKLLIQSMTNLNNAFALPIFTYHQSDHFTTDAISQFQIVIDDFATNKLHNSPAY